MTRTHYLTPFRLSMQLEPNKGEKLSLGSIVTLGDPSLASFKLVELED